MCECDTFLMSVSKYLTIGLRYGYFYLSPNKTLVYYFAERVSVFSLKFHALTGSLKFTNSPALSNLSLTIQITMRMSIVRVAAQSDRLSEVRTKVPNRK